MRLGDTTVADTFAEAFPMACTRLIITACDAEWAGVAATEVCGYASSVIGCDAEAGIERLLASGETPDGRPGVAVLVFAFSRDALQKAVVNRVGQCVLTCATTACYAGMTRNDRSISVGGQLRYFGDGYQVSKLHGDRRFWRVPTMDGEFLCEDEFGSVRGVAGGNLIAVGVDQPSALAAARRAVLAARAVPGVIAPFPGGVVRSGSKVGSRYKKLRASTNGAFCPTLVGTVPSELPPGACAAYEVVWDGVSAEAVGAAMRLGLLTAAGPGVLLLTAGNYGGKLGPHHFRLRDLLAGAA